MNNQPTPTQALQLLDNVAANVQLSRADHFAVQQAVNVLRAVITPAPVEEKAKAK